VGLAYQKQEMGQMRARGQSWITLFDCQPIVGHSPWNFSTKALTPEIASGNSTYSHLNGLTVKPKSPLDGPSKAVPNTGHGKIDGTPTEPVRLSAHILDEASDDEIKYETTPKPVVSDDVSEDGVEDDTSDNDTELGGDGDASLGSTASREADASSRQLFHPPDESDYGDETGDDDDDSPVSSSASSESSPAADEEPVVALPSASIQHQQDYPERILETAKSGRPYHSWLGTQIYP
jgi:hypothetical protein